VKGADDDDNEPDALEAYFKRYSQHPTEKRLWWSELKLLEVLAACEAALSAFAAVSAWTLSNSVDRAWLAAESQLQSLSFTGPRVQGEMTMTLQNFGHLPAIDIRFFPGLFSGVENEVLQRQQLYCEVARNHHKEAYVQPTVFLGAKITTPAFIISNKATLLDHLDSTQFWLAGCVVYRFAGDRAETTRPIFSMRLGRVRQRHSQFKKVKPSAI
jgi:hypothetical protein